MYYEVIDLVTEELERRFGQASLEIPKAIENLITSCNESESDFEIPTVLKDKYSVDINMKKLEHQLNLI